MVKRLILVVVAVLFFAVPVNAGNIKVTKSDGYLASASEEYFDKAMDLIVADDLVALQRMIDSNLVFILPGGIKVVVVETKFFSGKVKLRYVGQLIEFWTVVEAVKEI